MPRVATKKTVAKKASTVKAEQNGMGDLSEFAKPEEEELDSTGDWFVPIEETTDYINALLFGKEGSGKTTSIARLANLNKGKVLVINAEGGLKKIALQKRGVNMDNLVVWPDPKKGQRVSRKGLDEVFKRVKSDLMKDPTSWFAVSWDSVTEIHTAVLDAAQKERVRRAIGRFPDTDPDFVDRADYGTMTKIVRDLLRKYRDLPCHFFATGLERKDKDEDTKKSIYGPAVTPALATDVLGYVDLVLFMKAADEDGPYRALTKHSAKYRVKDRLDILPRVMAEPMGDRIFAYFHGELTEDTDPFQDDLPASAKKAQDRPPVVEEVEEDSDTEDNNEDN